jgi:hypothetical protein
MPYVICPDCYEEFYREDYEPWRVRCLSCYREYKKRHGGYTRPAYYNTTLMEYQKVREFLTDNIRFLIFATHPDRNPGQQEKALKVVQFLTEFRSEMRLIGR